MLHVVVMAGGSGTRFWPKSRRHRPKQLLTLHGASSMLRQTVDRVAPLVPPERVWVVTGADQAEAVRAQLPHVPAENVIAEPCPRDTSACVGLAAHQLLKVDPDATMLLLPADHVIEPASIFLRTVEAAAEVVESEPEAFIVFGVRPTRPETGYGYIERDELLGQPHGVAMHAVSRFREKPDRATAEAFLSSGRFVWNAGIFVWRADTILAALRTHQPMLWEALERVGQALGTEAEAQAIELEYPTMDRLPIDKAVLEKAGNLRVLEVTYDWNDVGDWRALTTLLTTDSEGNAVQGSTHLVDTRDCIIVSDEGLITTLGVEGLVIVQSGGATLVARRDQLDKLKGLVEGLERAGHGSYL